MAELSKHTECPHCGHTTMEQFEFDFDEADHSGCRSSVMKIECNNYDECGKTYWAKTQVFFDVEEPFTFTEVPA